MSSRHAFASAFVTALVAIAAALLYPLFELDPQLDLEAAKLADGVGRP